MKNPRLDKISRLPGVTEAVFHSLAQTRILVIGAGGLGAPVLLYLANSGICQIGICEQDTVSVTNLHRQVAYSLEDIGKSKAAVIRDVLLQRNPDLDIHLHPFINRANVLDIICGYDVVVDGSDNFATRYLVNDACVILNKPLVAGAVFQFEGQLGVWNIPGSSGARSTNYRDLFPQIPEGDIPDCNEGGVTGPLCGIIGSLMAQEVLKLAGMPGSSLSDTLCIFNSETNSWQSLAVFPHPENPLRPVPCLQDDYEQSCRRTDDISWAELQEWIDNGTTFLLVDVRTHEEFERMNVGGTNIPMSELEASIPALPTNCRLALVCQSGIRSGKAMDMILKSRPELSGNLFQIRGGFNSMS